jgi:TonB family protein
MAIVLAFLTSQGQVTVFQDHKGQLMTRGDIYGAGVLNATAYNQYTYQGSPFLTFPIWQKGTVQVDKYGKEIPAELAYNLVTNEILYRSPGDSAVQIITPETFTILDTRFIRPQENLPGTRYRTYFTILHNGQTKFLKSLTGRLEGRNSADAVRNGYDLDASISGTFHFKTDYYIQKGQAKPELVNLTKRDILSVLYEQADKLATKLPTKKLTVGNVSDVLRAYDSLMISDRSSKLPLLTDPAFTQTIHDKITYPEYAKTKRVYGRVYAGFDIDEQGQIKNIIILSPSTGDFRLDLTVRKALEKLPVLSTSSQGNYVLPVVFSFKKSKEDPEYHVPTYRLSDEQVKGKTLLEEFIVLANTPSISVQEVGYDLK